MASLLRPPPPTVYNGLGGLDSGFTFWLKLQQTETGSSRLTTPLISTETDNKASSLLSSSITIIIIIIMFLKWSASLCLCPSYLCFGCLSRVFWQCTGPTCSAWCASVCVCVKRVCPPTVYMYKSQISNLKTIKDGVTQKTWRHTVAVKCSWRTRPLFVFISEPWCQSPPFLCW